MMDQRTVVYRAESSNKGVNFKPATLCRDGQGIRFDLSVSPYQSRLCPGSRQVKQALPLVVGLGVRGR
jgi:hypothetical protein